MDLSIATTTAKRFGQNGTIVTTTIKASTAGDFLALVPSLLGFQPSESLVIVPFKGNRTLGAMRVDLPGDTDEAHYQTARQAMELAGRIPDVDYLVLVVFTASPAGGWVGFIELVEEYAHINGLEVRDLLLWGGDGYCSVNEDGMPLRPTSELAVHLDAPVPARDALAGTELPDVADDIVMDVTTFLSSFVDEPEDFDPIEFNEGAIVIGQPDRLAPSDLAKVIFTFDSPALRDIFIVQSASGKGMGEFALAAQLAWEMNLAEYPASIASAMWGDGEQPAPKRLEAGLELARWAAAISESPGALATAGWYSWALGKSTHAEHYVKLALELDPNHGLAKIIESFVEAGHLPAWAFQRRG
jgi:hypothetical protein